MTNANSGRIAVVVSGASLLAILGWTAVLAASDAPSRPNMYALMTEVVGPAANPIWEGGYAENLTDADWERMQQAATTLNATAPVIASGGELASDQERAKSPIWKERAAAFTETAAALNRAASAKDQMALAMGGDTLVEVCEACHMAFPAANP